MPPSSGKWIAAPMIERSTLAMVLNNVNIQYSARRALPENPA
jgi:hypothetical protein